MVFRTKANKILSVTGKGVKKKKLYHHKQYVKLFTVKGFEKPYSDVVSYRGLNSSTVIKPCSEHYAEDLSNSS